MKPQQSLPTDNEALARLAAVLAFIGISKSKFYQGITEGTFPRPIKYGRASLWRVGAIRAAARKLADG